MTRRAPVKRIKAGCAVALLAAGPSVLMAGQVSALDQGAGSSKGLPAAPASLAGMPPAKGTLGFVVTAITIDMEEGDPNACPKGMNASQSDIYLSTLDEAKRKELSHPDNLRDLIYGAASMNDRGKPICIDPDGPLSPALRPTMLTVQGSGPSYGLDLDGRVSTGDGKAALKSCRHAEFVGRDRRPGIDNQFYRVVGCTRGFRKEGILAQQTFGTEIRNGTWAVLFELSGVDDVRNDEDVTVSLFSSQDPAPYAGGTTPMPYRSLSVSPDPRFWATAKGRIKNGVLTTSPADFRFLITQAHPSQGYPQREVYLKGSRLELKLTADGNAEGTLAGYHDLKSYEDNFIRYKGHVAFSSGSSFTMKYSCASLQSALWKHADGYPDETGRCSAISTAFTIKAIPAFVIKNSQGGGLDGQPGG